MQLQLTQPGRLHTRDLIPADPIIRWKVDLGNSHVYAIGFNLGRPGQKSRWKITGRKDKYNTPEEALAVLQAEEDKRLA